VRVPIAGWLWLLLVATLMGIGLLRRINLLTLLACPLLVVWCLNVVLAHFQLRRLRGRRRIEGPVFAETPFDVLVEVASLRRAAHRSVRVEDGGPSHRSARFLPRLAGRQTQAFRITLTLPDRGRHAWGPLWAWSGYPFGLARRGLRLVEGEDVIVLPRLGRLHGGKLRQFMARSTTAAEPIRRTPRRRIEAQAEFHGLRAFRAGDSPRWIHWRTTARRGELMVREFEDAPGEHVILVVDLYVPFGESEQNTHPSGADLAPRASRSALAEDAIRFAATVCWDWRLQQGNRFVLGVAGAKPAVLEGTTGRGHALRLLDCLAVAEAHGNGDELSVVDELSRVFLPPAPVLLVSARANRLENALARALNRPVICIEASELAHLEFYESPNTVVERYMGM
jgi:uncharacterized protein (DUF58 family)